MPLSFTGQSVTTPNFGRSLEASDGNSIIAVLTSEEAIQDFGLDAVQQKASDKYDAGQLDETGRVIVFTDDLRRPD